MDRMIIEWIGTGSGLNFKLGNTSFIIRGNDRNLLVDCGSTVPEALMNSSDISKITDIIVTHAHADHIGGLEGLGFMNYFAFRRRGDARPNLYVATNDFAHNLWEHSLQGGMVNGADEEGNPIKATLDTYFKVHVGKGIDIQGLPTVALFETPHIPLMENYGLNIGKNIFYSGDTIALPPPNPELIFQDCQFFEGKGDVHTSYSRLKRELSLEVKAKTYLTHLGGGYEKEDPKKDGFAGFVMPRQRFPV